MRYLETTHTHTQAINKEMINNPPIGVAAIVNTQADKDNESVMMHSDSVQLRQLMAVCL